MPSWRRQQRKARQALEGLAMRGALGLFRALPLDGASALGGFLGRSIGPRLGASKRARLNLRRALPDLDADAVEAVVAGMWDNLGRVVAEFPHLGAIEIYTPGGRVEAIGVEALLEERRRSGRPSILFSAHYGNWEVSVLAGVQAGLPLSLIYRAPNNSLVDDMVLRMRDKMGVELLPKGRQAARGAVEALKKGRTLCLLVDQKMNDGIPVPFFGRDAMTAPALARLALRFNCLCVPVRVDRLGGAHFRVTCEPALPLPQTGDLQADTLAVMTQVNATVERWVRERPEQWFWLHRRWPD